MNRNSLLLQGACAFLLLTVSCSGGETERITAPADTLVNVHIDPVDPAIGLPITFTITASNPQANIREVAIDFTGDGVWDEMQQFQQSAVTAAFTHTYNTAGGVDVFVDVRTSNAVESRVMRLVVSRDILVTYTLYGWSQRDGGCYADGLPAVCDNCAELLGTFASTGVTRSLGRFPSGAIVTLNQGFNQWPVDPGQNTYACQFVLHLVAGEGDGQVAIGNGTCETNSITSPPLLKCRIGTSGQVR